MKQKIKCFFGFHKWKFYSTQVFRVIDKDGLTEGEVTLAFYDCIHCNKPKLVPSDRVHYIPRQKPTSAKMNISHNL